MLPSASNRVFLTGERDAAGFYRPGVRCIFNAGKFNWHEAVWHLRVPVLRALFQQLSDPGRLQPLGLVEVLDLDFRRA